MKNDDLKTLANMTKYGGAFVENLSLTAMVADEENYQRLKFAFNGIWEKYAAMSNKTAEAQRESVCQACRGAIKFNGRHWEHIPVGGSIPRHIPMPLSSFNKPVQYEQRPPKLGYD